MPAPPSDFVNTNEAVLDSVGSAGFDASVIATVGAVVSTSHVCTAVVVVPARSVTATVN